MSVASKDKHVARELRAVASKAKGRAMSKKHRCKQTATSKLPSRGARFFLAEVASGNVTLAELIESKKRIETDPQMPNAGMVGDAIQAYYGDVCEAITLLTSSTD